MRMRNPRLARFVGLCVALGMATTGVVAWALAAWLPHDGLTRRFSLKFGPRGTDYCVRVYEYRRAGMVRRWWRIERGTIAAFPLAAEDHEAAVAGIVSGRVPGRRWGGLGAALADGEGAEPEALEAGYGWPMVALWWRAPGCVLPRGFDDPASGVSLSGPAATPRQLRALPLMPAMDGLVADTLLFAGVWAGAIPLGCLVRRRWRRRRGRCPVCNYDLRRDLAAGCPECGWSRAAP